MGFYRWIQKTDRAIADAYVGTTTYFCLSPTRLSLTQVLFPRMRQYITGRCLDAGAGRMAYRHRLILCASEYIALDVQPRPHLDAIGSALELPLQNNVFDCVFCSQVLEHVPDPLQALHEYNRCLKPNGILLLTTPHLAYLHNEPHDYFRYTRYGLQTLLQKSGFEILEISPAGGLLAFLGHIPSLIAKALFFRVPVIGTGVIHLNTFASRLLIWLDNRMDAKKIFALNYVAVARKIGERKP
jgi:SAM-dependent methyltransferase